MSERIATFTDFGKIKLRTKFTVFQSSLLLQTYYSLCDHFVLKYRCEFKSKSQIILFGFGQRLYAGRIGFNVVQLQPLQIVNSYFCTFLFVILAISNLRSFAFNFIFTISIRRETSLRCFLADNPNFSNFFTSGNNSFTSRRFTNS